MNTAALAPSFRRSPETKVKIDRLRLHTDIIGLAAVHTLLPFSRAFPGWVNLLLSVYNVMALVTVLTVDATRLPEAAATKIGQKQAWKAALQAAPIWLLACGTAVWLTGKAWPHPMLPSLGLLINLYMNELIFRNILQPALRKIKLPRWAAIVGQSLLYALPYGIAHQDIGNMMCLFILSLANGRLVAKYRSLWPAFANSTLLFIFIR